MSSSSSSSPNPSSSGHYALVNAGSNPVIIPDSDSNNNNKNSRSHRTDDPRQELSQLYQKYAEMYPNPRLVEEYRMKNELLQATQAAAGAQNYSSGSASSRTNRGGFFSRLFGGGGGTTDLSSATISPQQQENFEASLVYQDIPNEDDDGSMCGTQQSLDHSCIPLEAVSAARFHLTSMSMRGNQYPNAIRWGSLLGRSVPTSLVIVGLGLIAEFQPNKPSTILSTSDRRALMDYSRTHPDDFQVEYVRACGISPNCVAISWGFQDGFLGIYRRIQFPNDERCGWEQLWLVQPSAAVLDASRDVFEEEEDKTTIHHPRSPLLRIVEMLPLRVITGDKKCPMVATLAIARLGCHLELLPIPTDLWFGPLLTPENHKRPRIPKRKPRQHYSFGKYIGSPSVALTMAHHHLDILSMDSLRTTVGIETEWNQQAYPDGPPAEFILAISGLSRQSPGRECISFWTVCTLFTDETENEKQQHGIGFELHSTFLESTVIYPGADITFFATPEIMQHWRMPRRVELRRDAPMATFDGTENSQDAQTLHVTTISTPAPIISVQFMDQKGKSSLAVMDWNGGVTLFDCAPIERTAAQSLSWGELARLDLAAQEGQTKPSKIREFVSRSQFSIASGRRSKVGALQWLNVDTNEIQNDYNGSSCALVLLLRNEKKLLVVSFDSEGEIAETPRSSIVSLPFPSDGAAMGNLGVGNLSFVSKTRERGDSYKLKFFVMRNLPPVAIVESLAREGKYEEAIAASKRLNELDQETLSEVIEECHCRLWENTHDIDHLADTRNVGYVVDQATAICESPFESIKDMSFDSLRLLCQLAIAMGRNHGPVQESIRKLGDFLIRLGTYELICQCCGTIPDVAVFLGDFQRISISDLAMTLAERGDTSSLSVVVFRHRSEILGTIFSILSNIPASLDLESFVHLIPIVKKGHAMDTFLPTTFQLAELHISEMPQHLKDSIGLTLVLDKSDERMVLERVSFDENKGGHGISISQAVKWFERRSTIVQEFVGDLQSIFRVCKVGLWCNGFDFGDVQVPRNELQSLYRTWRGAQSLHRILLDDFLALESDGKSETSNTTAISVDELLSMDLPDVVDLILRGESDCIRIRTRCLEFLQPLLLELQRDSTSEDVDAFDEALSSYCMGLVADCLKHSQRDPNNEIVLVATAKALGTCTAIVSASNSSIRKQDRLIKDIGVLIKLVLAVINDMATALEARSMRLSEEKEFIEALWTMYEALPDQLPASMPQCDKLLPLVKQLDEILYDMTCADILSRWPGSKPLSFLVKRRKTGNDFDEGTGAEVVIRLCRLFVSNLRFLKTKEDPSVLLQDLLLDVQQVNMCCCQGVLSLPQLLTENLVLSLLEAQYFNLLVRYGQSDACFVDQELLKGVVLAFVDNAVFSDNDSVNPVKAAMKCQDIVGAAFPEIRAGLTDMRRYLDAVHFITTVIYDGRPNRPIRPSDLRKQLPFDAVESILHDKPESIVCGCPQWRDVDYATSANESLRSAGSTRHRQDESQNDMPALPGGAIFHLATILGLHDQNAALAVKCRVIHHAVSIGLHGAAAAVCRTLSATDGTGVEDEAATLAKLGAVAEIAGVKAYADQETKHELCRDVFFRVTGRLELSNTDSFTRIATILAGLEHERSRHNPVSQGWTPERRKRLLSRPLSRLQHQIMAEYNADVHGLFADLINQTSYGVVHDALMNALSRFVIYWCISDSKMLRHRIVRNEKNDAMENWSLGCSLILHIPSRLTAGNCVHELQKIAADQASFVSGEACFGKDYVCLPDQDIVARMIHRGYTETAARRAAVMTKNAGYNEALGWAFAHANDSNFNEPIVVVRDQNRLFIDDDAIQTFQKYLHATESWLEDSTAMERLCSFLLRQHGDGKVSLAEQAPSGRAAAKAPPKPSQLPAPKPVQKPPVAEKVNVHPKTTVSKLVTPVAKVPPRPKPTVVTSLESPRSLDAAHQNGSKQTPRPSPVVQDQRQQMRKDSPGGSSSKPTSPVAAKFPSRLASPRDGDETRLALLKRGQEALTKRRMSGEVPDRTRLIANGRELLRKSRIPTDTSNGTSARTPRRATPRNEETASLPLPANRELPVQNGSAKNTKQPRESTSDASGWNFDEFDDM